MKNVPTREPSTVRILVADDEEDVLKAIKALMRRANIPDLEVVTVRSAEEGLEILRATRFDVVVSDHRMGRMSGVDFLEEVKRRFPTTGRIMITAYSEEDIAVDAINRAQVHAYIKKPWAAEAFIQLVRRVLAEARRAREFEDAVEKGLVAITPPHVPVTVSPATTQAEA